MVSTTKEESFRSMVRVRFAPSPTGFMHIGNLRTAIFNWLFARHNNGQFLIRIEDTDAARSKPEYIEDIFHSLSWVGISSDEPVMTQSDFRKTHQDMAHELVKEGKAYKCYCTPDELTARLSKTVEGYIQYDRHCEGKSNADKPYVIRFKVPDDLVQVTFEDLIRGPITFKREQLDDFIIVRSDGLPVYNFVAVIDDAHMRITHIIRGEDHISNTPKQILLYHALTLPLPAFAHLPMILASDGSRLSKRDAATGVNEYRKAGYLADALFNYLVRLGWSHGDQELFTREELVRYFTLKEVGRKSAIFDIQKLDWMNGMYIRQLSPTVLLAAINELDPSFIKECHEYESKLERIIACYQDRSTTLIDLAKQVRELIVGPTEVQLSRLNMYPKTVTAYFDAFSDQCTHKELSPEEAKEIVTRVCKKFSIRLPDFAKPFRVAITGKEHSPGIFELISICGCDEIRKRLANATAVIKSKEIE